MPWATAAPLGIHFDQSPGNHFTLPAFTLLFRTARTMKTTAVKRDISRAIGGNWRVLDNLATTAHALALGMSKPYLLPGFE